MEGKIGGREEGEVGKEKGWGRRGTWGGERAGMRQQSVA